MEWNNNHYHHHYHRCCYRYYYYCYYCYTNIRGQYALVTRSVKVHYSVLQVLITTCIRTAFPVRLHGECAVKVWSINVIQTQFS